MFLDGMILSAIYFGHFAIFSPATFSTLDIHCLQRTSCLYNNIQSAHQHLVYTRATRLHTDISSSHEQQQHSSQHSHSSQPCLPSNRQALQPHAPAASSRISSSTSLTGTHSSYPAYAARDYQRSRNSPLMTSRVLSATGTHSTFPASAAQG